MIDLAEQKKLENELKVSGENGKPVLRVGLCFTLYFWDGHTDKKRSAIAKCFEEYKQSCGGYLKWEKNPQTLKFQEFDKGKLPKLTSYLKELDPNDGYDLCCHGGDKKDDASFFSISSLGSKEWENELSYIRFSVPVSWLDEKPGNYIEMAENFSNLLKPFHGYGGYGLINSPDSSIAADVETDVFKLSQYFSCIDVDYPVSHTLYLSEGIKGVNWLTVLSDEFIDKLGGKDKLVKVLGADEFIYRQFDGGMILQCEDEPCIGSDELPVPNGIKKINSVTKKIRVSKIGSFGHVQNEGEDKKYDENSTLAWLSRFD